MSLLFVLLLAAGVVVLRERARRQRTGGARATGGEVAISCGVASAVAGGAELARLLFTHSTWTVDGVPLFGASLVGGLPMLAGFLWAARGAAARGKRTSWFLLATFGALSFCLTLTRDANIDLDFEPAATREVRVLNLEQSMTLRGGTSYYLRLADWTDEGAARELDISRRQYHGYAIGQTVAFEEHGGALGFRWLGNLRAARVSGDAAELPPAASRAVETEPPAPAR